MLKKLITLNNILSVAAFAIVMIFAKPSDKAFSDIVTFISIAAGFSITSLSIIATSTFSKNLYLKENPKNRSQTLLHVLVGNFKNSIFFFTFTVCLILIYKYIDFPNYTISIRTYSFDLIKLFSGFIWYFTILSMVRFVLLVNIFGQFVLQTAKQT
ncbi:hypothetical protein I2I11_15160 [Pontibacter sp. 172403-2]|uniref:hypothetical protein n=1 Tax=Pontibacter rufus TaxID=2791028 RepID=UPI0018B014DB|nr:hypothetical protein [Pontibacter sp. 172403-2]MBF9254642.1 hypothetical protein [Pontibacter sp. 172403-2]